MPVTDPADTRRRFNIIIDVVIESYVHCMRIWVRTHIRFPFNVPLKN